MEFDAIGCRNEKGYSLKFAKMLRKTLDANGFEKVKIHAFDNWPADKFDFAKDLLTDEEARNAINIIGAHIMYERDPATAEVQAMAARMNKPIWNTEEHVYKKGFDATISIVEAFNENFIRSGATKIVNWYDIAGIYPIEPYSEDSATLVAHWPWSGHYKVREALWGYAHYGQFTEAGWQYLNGGYGHLCDLIPARLSRTTTTSTEPIPKFLYIGTTKRGNLLSEIGAAAFPECWNIELFTLSS